MVVLLKGRSTLYSFTWPRIIPKMWGKAWLSGQTLGTEEWVGTSTIFSLLPCPSENSWSFDSLPFLSFHSPITICPCLPIIILHGKESSHLFIGLRLSYHLPGKKFLHFLIVCFSTHYSSEMYVIHEQLETWPWRWMLGGFVWRR